MATEVLRPQDCLIQRIRVSPASFPRRKACNYGNSYSNPSRSSARPNRKQQIQQYQQPAKPEPQRKRYVPAQSETSTSSRSSSSDDLRQARSSSGHLVMEKVTILRRGESLDSKIKSQVSEAASDLVVFDGTQRLGPDPEMVPKQVRIVDLRSPAGRRCDVYAGSAFAVSPEPSSLPLPSFSKKKHLSFDDSATRDLRRLLRLD
ncbi:hypothetical protein BT93_B0891 [Corymbia citriodora subsp. variegata]|nr:hypothetical protein BT93_B0891 [Corymbia citriodora subsp. variegata]